MPPPPSPEAAGPLPSRIQARQQTSIDMTPDPMCAHCCLFKKTSRASSICSAAKASANSLSFFLRPAWSSTLAASKEMSYRSKPLTHRPRSVQYRPAPPSAPVRYPSLAAPACWPAKTPASAKMSQKCKSFKQMPHDAAAPSIPPRPSVSLSSVSSCSNATFYSHSYHLG